MICVVSWGFTGGLEQAAAPDDSFFISKTWRMSEVLVNGASDPNVDISNYKLTLNQDNTFVRINFDGEEEQGNWNLGSSGNQLLIFAGTSAEERYLIIELQIRLLELQLTQSNRKTGEEVNS